MIIPQSETKIFLLSLLVFSHSVFILCSIIFMGFHWKTGLLLDLIVLAPILSFVIFKKCILIDIYDYIKNLDNIEHSLPDRAKDNYLRNIVKKFFKVNTGEEVDYTPLRLDVLENIDPLLGLSDCQMLQTFHNRKIHYIIGNVIITLLMFQKYQITKLLPIFVAWLVKTFKV